MSRYLPWRKSQFELAADLEAAHDASQLRGIVHRCRFRLDDIAEQKEGTADGELNFAPAQP
jgi:hypothetical protein